MLKMIEKPSWDGAPEFAQYLAMDSDGAWYWYELRPRYVMGAWISSGHSEPCDIYEGMGEGSLEKRPEADRHTAQVKDESGQEPLYVARGSR